MNEGLFTNEALIAQAREWCSDCDWLDSEDIADLTPAEVLAGVERHYEGGLAQFIKDGEAKPISPLPAEVFNDPTASDWLKQAVRACLRRDVVDALNDAMILVAVLERRYEALTTTDR